MQARRESSFPPTAAVSASSTVRSKTRYTTASPKSGCWARRQPESLKHAATSHSISLSIPCRERVFQVCQVRIIRLFIAWPLLAEQRRASTSTHTGDVRNPPSPLSMAPRSSRSGAAEGFPFPQTKLRRPRRMETEERMTTRREARQRRRVRTRRRKFLRR